MNGTYTGGSSLGLCLLCFGAMLQNSAYYVQIVLYKSTIKLHKLTTYFLLSYKIMSITSLMYTCINTLNSLCCICNTYLTKPLPQIHPNLIILHEVYILYKFHWSCWQFLPIMLALYSMLLSSYYAQNYAGIIGSSLIIIIIHYVSADWNYILYL